MACAATAIRRCLTAYAARQTTPYSARAHTVIRGSRAAPIGAPQRGKKRFTGLAKCKPNGDTNLKLDVLVAHRLKQFEQ